MKTQLQTQRNAKNQKRIIIFGLFVFAAAIIISGTFFCIYSYMNGISLKVLSFNVPGVVFGILVVYLGIRGTVSVIRLRPQLYRDDARFSWSNFKKKNTAKENGKKAVKTLKSCV